MLEGLSDLISRVSELEHALEGWSASGAATSAVRSASTSEASGASSFQQTLQQAQGGRAVQVPSGGTDGATQMPEIAGVAAGAAAGQVGGEAAVPAGAASKGDLPGTLLKPHASPFPEGGGMTSSLPGGGGMTGSRAMALLGGIGGSEPGSAGAGLWAGPSAGDSMGDPNGSLWTSGPALGTQYSAVGTSNSGLAGLLDGVASQAGIDPALAKAVARAESGFDPNAISPAGAAGLMQLMPGTFRQYTSSSEQGPSGSPVYGPISQGFGPTSFANEPPLRWNGRYYQHFHTGLDIAATAGTPIRATMAGTLEIRSDPAGYGNLVVIRNGSWDALYGHTEGHPANLHTGSMVQAGDVIGFVGSTGNSTGPHLHYEVRRNGQIIDPRPFLTSASDSQLNPLNPVANVTAGVNYLKDLLTRFKGNVPEALAAYNAGPAAVERYGGVPPYPETQAYVNKALQYARDFSA